MLWLVFLLLLFAVMLGLLCRGLFMRLEERDEEIAQVRQQLEQYLSDDEGMLDALWNRAQIETARAMRERGKHE